MPKLIIQVPCFNEETRIGTTLAELPRSLPGIDQIEFLIVDDGSTDGTSEVTRRCGADHVLRLPVHVGLARAFQAGLRAAVASGADYVVNTDADGQYVAAGIRHLLCPLLEGRADIVIGERRMADIPHFSQGKKLMQKLGSSIVSRAANTKVPDATSGFRAFTRDVAAYLLLLSKYTYTLEMIIQASHGGFVIQSVPIEVRPPTRPSRLMHNCGEYVLRSAYTILRLSAHYIPLRFFGSMGALAFVPGALLMLRYGAREYLGEASHVSLLILGCMMVLLGALAWLTGLCADIVAGNRRYAQDSRRQLQELRALLESSTRSEPQADAIARDCLSDLGGRRRLLDVKVHKIGSGGRA